MHALFLNEVTPNLSNLIISRESLITPNLSNLIISRESIEAYATTTEKLAKEMTEILAENLDVSSAYFQENCLPKTKYLRMNRCPPCPFYSWLFRHRIDSRPDWRVATLGKWRMD